MAHRQARPRRYLAGAYGPRRSGETEDRYIKAIESKAGKPAVVHHLLTYAVASDDEAESSGDDSNAEAGDFLNEFAVGKNGDLFPRAPGGCSRRARKSASTSTITRSAKKRSINRRPSPLRPRLTLPWAHR